VATILAVERFFPSDKAGYGSHLAVCG